jgi:4-coumarate--CoA ligase
MSNLCVGYGLTETSPTVFLLPAPDADGHVGSTGVLLPNLELKLVAESEGEVSALFPAFILCYVRSLLVNSSGTHRHSRCW